MTCNRWVSDLQITHKKQQSTFQSIIQKIQTMNIYQRLSNLQNRYQMYKSINIIFKKNKKLMEEFGKNFFKAFLFFMVPKYKEEKKFEKEKVGFILQLKKFYMDIFNNTQEGRRSFVLQFYCFLLCLAVKGVMDQVTGQILDTSHLFKKRNINSQRIQIAQIAFIFLTYQTLGLKVGTSAFSLLFKKYVLKETIHETLFDLGKICISHDFLKQLSKPKEKTKTEADMFQSSLRQNLKALKPEQKQKQKEKKLQHLKTHMASRNSSQFYFQSNFLDNQTVTLNQTMKGNQISTSFNFYNKYQFKKGSRTPTIKMFPINQEKLNKMSRKRVRQMTQFRLKQTQKKQTSLSQKKCQLRYWQGKIKQMKNQITHRMSYQNLSFKYRNKQQNQKQNLLERYKGKTIRTTMTQSNQQIQPIYVTLVHQQQQKIHRCQLGLIARMQNYPCARRKSDKKRPLGIKPVELKHELQNFTQTCKQMQKYYKDKAVNQTLGQPMPYLGKKNKRRKQSCL